MTGLAVMLGPQEVRESGAVVSVPVHAPGGTQELWFRVRPEWGHLLATSGDAAAVGLLPYAMRMGWDVEVMAPMSARLHAALNGPVQEILAVANPKFRRVGVRHHGLYEGAPRDREGLTATGFSAGIDSWWVVGQHLIGETKLDALTFHDVGSHGVGELGERAYQKRLAFVCDAAQAVGLPLVEIRSNLGELLARARVRFFEVSTVANVAAALACSGGISEYLLAASYHERDNVAREHRDITLRNPELAPLLGTESFTVRPVGGHLTRVERTEFVAGLEESRGRLDVCFRPLSPRRNCGACRKCVRTCLTLAMLGKLELFAELFDLEAFWREVPRYVRDCFGSTDPLNWEILDYAERHGIDLVEMFLGPQEPE